MVWHLGHRPSVVGMVSFASVCASNRTAMNEINMSKSHESVRDFKSLTSIDLGEGASN